MSNHVNYERRLEYINSILALNNLKAEKIEPVEYNAECPFPYNNFIYHIHLETPTASEKIILPCKPGTSLLPANTSSLIMRLANPDAIGINNNNRIENEVASISLARDAVKLSAYKNIIPAIYAWDGIGKYHCQGWTMQEFMPGVPIDSAFESMSLEDKKVVLKQMAEILALIQVFGVPESVTGFGGLGLDAREEMMSAEMTTCKGGPFNSYAGMVVAMCKDELVDADKSDLIAGWRDGGVRERLDAFLSEGVISDILHKASIDERKVLVHGDFTTNNILLDPKSFRITALLDFDFSHVATVADEHLRSFGTMDGGQLPSSYADAAQLLREAMLSGIFPDPLPVDENLQWELAKAWDEELKLAHAQKPATIKGFSVLQSLN